ncbi:hypothetical protein EVAR_97793_1 [Eumeta japonica]|uniref:Uncharacterized protein n=1 Tax=Eumeta variegata TaxID=151549 RepID=A0A4C1XBR9_EUMVA|nr:hypothetical protein EVAR_97793_1 [Eumeta japonica]
MVTADHGHSQLRRSQLCIANLLEIESKWSSPPMDIRNRRGIITALPASWVGIEYLTLREDDGEGVGHWKSYSLDESEAATSRL